MANARLTSIKLDRFKSYGESTRLDIAPLTVVLGRNNSGKSSIIQALLLLKQTLALPRADVPLHLEGMVDALSLREITSGWPKGGADVEGPTITLRWTSRVDVQAALDQANKPDLGELARQTNLKWIGEENATRELSTSIALDFAEVQGRTVLRSVTLKSFAHEKSIPPDHTVVIRRTTEGQYECLWGGTPAKKVEVELDHFLPYLTIDRRNVGPRSRERSWHNAYLIVFAQPLDDLKLLIQQFAYLGSMRTLPATLYRPATVPPEDVGVSGEYAAQLLHARRTDLVHYLPPLREEGGEWTVPELVRARHLVDALNDVLSDLTITTPLEVEDVKDVGFRLLFGRASMQHVGRGLSYLLPVIELGLVADPLRFRPAEGDIPLAAYLKACPSFAHCALEEPEAHLHPKVQARLAHWFVSLAMAGRRTIIETHSDHLVRRLRGLVARTERGSELEKWLLGNVRVIEVEQQDGQSRVRHSALTPEGGLAEHWPADFMDEATSEEQSIYDASLDKGQPEAAVGPALNVEHDEGPEPEVEQ